MLFGTNFMGFVKDTKNPHNKNANLGSLVWYITQYNLLFYDIPEC